jgi:hypothetical protein
MGIRTFFRVVRDRLIESLVAELRQTKTDTHRLAIIAKAQYIDRILSDPKYSNPLRLEPSGLKIFSQFDEDGIIQEIFNRIGTTNKRFVEFGVGTGIENNTLALLLYGWKGLWIEGNDRSVAEIQSRFSDVLSAGHLSLVHSLVTAENINELIGSGIQGEIDLLSVDIDGNDYYVFDAIHVVQPRVVVIEYNAKFPPALSIVQKYHPDYTWDLTDYYGASLNALVRVARRRGYCLVGCNLAGANAFFVRDDLVGEKFHKPFSAENHYQPARYFLYQLYVSGQSDVPGWGPYVHVSDTGHIEK